MKAPIRSNLATLAVFAAIVGGSTACRKESEALDMRAEPLAHENVRSTREPEAARPAMNPLSNITAPGVAPAPADTGNPAAYAKGTSFRLDGVAAGDVLNIRSAPDADALAEGYIPAGAMHVEGLGESKAVGPATWQRVRYGGVDGWVNARFLRENTHGAPPQPPPPAKMNLVAPLVCFGDEPGWRARFGADGNATVSRIDGTAPTPLRVDGIMAMEGGPGAFDLLDLKGKPWLSVVVAKTGQCSDGMSDDPHPYEFTGTGPGGKLTGCCWVKGERAR